MTSTAPCPQCGQLTELESRRRGKGAICAQSLARSAATERDLIRVSHACSARDGGSDRHSLNVDADARHDGRPGR